MAYWAKPKIEKVYEALTAVADGRIKITGDGTAVCASSSGKKFYHLKFDSDSLAMTSNDNMAYYQKSLSYPMMALLIVTKKVDCPEELPKYFAGIKWKEINTRFKNNYKLSVDSVLEELKSKNVDVEDIKALVETLFEKIKSMQISILGNSEKPPQGY